MPVDFVWLEVNGQRSPAKWHVESDGSTVGASNQQPIARHRLLADEEGFSVGQLAERYPAPAKVVEK